MREIGENLISFGDIIRKKLQSEALKQTCHGRRHLGEFVT